MSFDRRRPRGARFGAVALAVLLAPLPSAGASQSSTNQSAPVDPATSAFVTDAGVILIAVKPALTAEYEQAVRTLQEMLAKDTDPARRSAAQGWRVFKAAETDAKGNVLYVHLLLPAIPGFDYRPSLLLDALVKDLAPELLSKYQESIAGAPSKLSLTEFANMTVAPLPPAAPKKPGGR
ncbi:MAG: hypothetical protein A3J29_11895 [Acidobacteria bacterium RIFCSPLOWO2_12_FULL_67_14b]|nr:MAG: hypothetical protein A3J29_11895 [Acidobacteria bacterium RIFCSPLOWO2_12_FULL_67_14b]